MKSNVKLVCIIGRTCSGKDSLAHAISLHTGIDIIVSYTTRPKRDYEEDGKQHFFITEEEYEKDYAKKDKLAYTEINGYKYFTLFDQVANSKTGEMLYIIDPVGYYDLVSRYRYKIDIKSVYVECPREIREARYNKREDSVSVPFETRDKAENEQFAEFEEVDKSQCDVIINTGNIDIFRFVYPVKDTNYNSDNVVAQ